MTCKKPYSSFTRHHVQIIRGYSLQYISKKFKMFSNVQSERGDQCWEKVLHFDLPHNFAPSTTAKKSNLPHKYIIRSLS